ncbi:MAG: acyl-CoA dehydrogenase family protein [Granulosicoccus sp.]
MELNYSADDIDFRNEVRAFLDASLQEELTDKVELGLTLSKAEHEQWHALLNARGWLAPNWPRQFGGAEWSAVRRHIFDEECALANAPRTVPFGLMMLGPVLHEFGSAAQQDYWLPRILNGDDWWCQGYSEPGAGSDLAGLKTRAVREGDHYVVNGQKTWTTLGQHANMIFCLVRTDSEVRAQQGISFLLIDMNTPGVEVRPIVLLDGSAEVNEIWFSDVRVPVDNLVGEENKGWTYAKYLLTHERTNIAGVGFARAGLAAVKRMARSECIRGKPLSENPLFAARIAEIEIDLMAMATTNLRIVSAASSGQAPGIESSMLKVKGTVIRQAINDLMRRIAGPQAVPFASEELEDEQLVSDPMRAGRVSMQYFNNRKLSIYGGSNEIQRQIIAKDAFGGRR